MTDTDTEARERLEALEARVTALMAPAALPQPPRMTELHSEAEKAATAARHRRVQAAAERAREEQEQAERDAPLQAKRDAERAEVNRLIIAEQERHEQVIRELGMKAARLAKAPLREGVFQR